jgi:hypothetical protein
MSSDKPVAPSPVAVSNKKPKHHPAFGIMKGIISVAPGVDLTEPAFPEWAQLIEEKYGKDA